MLNVKSDRYYYVRMSPDDKQAYKTIHKGLRERSYNITVPVNIPSDRIHDIYQKVLFDEPMFYYINQTVIRWNGGPGRYYLLPEYLYTKNEIESLNADIRKVLSYIDNKVSSVRGNAFKLERLLHDSVVKSVAYDYDSLKKNDCFNAHSIIGAFIDRKAVCEGVAKAFKLLCNIYGIKCIVVLGKADQAGDFGSDSYHAWNLVKIGSQSYHVDVTWDNMYDKGLDHISYDYFNLTTADIMRDHRSIGDYPQCSSTDLNYFVCTKSIVKTYEELKKLVRERINFRAIMFRTSTAAGEFKTPGEIHIKTADAFRAAISSRRTAGKCTMVFNDPYGIGKILFLK